MAIINPRSRLLVSAVLVGFGFGLAANACLLPNPDHCQNLALDPNAWCRAHHGEQRPYCSPCEADDNGCVSAEPSKAECPGYSPLPSEESDSETETDSGESGQDDSEAETDSGESGGDDSEAETDSGDESETGETD